MKIGINASFLRKQHTGIGQVTINFLKKLIESSVIGNQSSENEYVLYLEEDIDLELPENFQKRIFLPLWKRDDLIRKYLWEKCLLPKKAKKDKCDAFISLYQCPTVIKKIPHIMIVHDIIPRLFPQYLGNWRQKLYWKQTERAFLKTSKIIAVSRQTEKDLLNHYRIDPECVTVAYVAADELFARNVADAELAAVLKKYNLLPGYLYTGGGLEVRKNTESILRAYKTLLEERIQDLPKLVISGKLLPKSLQLATDVEMLVDVLGIKEHVMILGFVPQEDLPALYRGASMFVYPSYYEGFGLPVLEAMMQGTPVITSKRSSLPEIGGDSVLYCDPQHIDDIAMVMRNLLKNRHLQESLSFKGIDRAKKFSWNRFAEKMLHVIDNLEHRHEKF